MTILAKSHMKAAGRQAAGRRWSTLGVDQDLIAIIEVTNYPHTRIIIFMLTSAHQSFIKHLTFSIMEKRPNMIDQSLLAVPDWWLSMPAAKNEQPRSHLHATKIKRLDGITAAILDLLLSLMRDLFL